MAILKEKSGWPSQRGRVCGHLKRRVGVCIKRDCQAHKENQTEHAVLKTRDDLSVQRPQPVLGGGARVLR